MNKKDFNSYKEAIKSAKNKSSSGDFKYVKVIGTSVFFEKEDIYGQKTINSSRISSNNTQYQSYKRGCKTKSVLEDLIDKSWAEIFLKNME